MAKFGHLQEFDTDLEPITAYLERVELYFSANGIGEDKKLAILLSVIGPKTYGVLRNLLAPSRPQEKKFSEVTEVLIRHFEPKLIVIAERFSFYRRSQLVGESVADFVAELRRLARNCQFGDFLDEALRDRLVCGLQNEAIQRRLLTEAKLTFAGALELAKAQEAAELQAKQFKDPDIGVHKLSTTRLSEKDTREQCTHCGRRNHPPDQCRLKDYTCHKCGRGAKFDGQRVDTSDGDRLEDTVSGFTLGNSPSAQSGKMRHFKATLKLLPDVQPKFHRPRPVLFVLKEAVERELDRLEEAGVMKKIDANGIHATGEKLDAVLMAPVPSSVPQLWSFLGMINYYSKFIPNLATLLNPLNELLRKDVQWKWTDQREQAFKQAKQCLTSPNVLVHYDPTLPIKLAGDASAYGIGAVISHTLPDGSERPIAFASRTLNASERNYAQLEKEALSLIFGVKKFHEYLYGRRFTLLTDHKPLTTILGPKTGVPPLAAARLQRWALLLSAYEYDLEFRPTAQHANADGLSRLPLSIIADAGTATSDSDVFNVGQIEALPVTAMQLRKVTRQDPILSKVVTFTRNGWPSIVPENLKPYWTRRNELTVEGDCLMWGIRVVVPAKLQEHVLQELHKEHPGASRMKALARSYLWWPGLDKLSDNGPQFVSAEFETFMRNNGIKHIRCAPYHPSSNGLAERFIQTFKKAMLAGDREGCDLKYRLCQFLLKYRSSPHTTTDVAPCELFLKRSMRTRLDMLKPDLQRMVLDQQAHQKLIHDKHARGREFVVGQNVMVRNLLNGPKWVSGVISEQRGPLTYLVEVGPNQYWRRHVDHIRDKGDSTLREGTEEGKSFGIPDGPIQADSAMDIPEQDTNEPYMNDQYPGRVAEYPAVENTELPEPVAEPRVVNEHLPAPETGIHRYPQRQRRPPDRY
eukprot:Em0001g2089a